MTTGQRWSAFFWLGGLVVLALALWLLSPILLPFVVSMAIAYLLNPVVDRLEHWRVPRSLATALVLLLFLLGIVLVIKLLLPLLEVQVDRLAKNAPELVNKGNAELQQVIQILQTKLSPDDFAHLRDMAGSWAGSALATAASVGKSLLTSGLAIANLLELLLITPIVAFFLLRDWKKIVTQIDSWLPREHAATIREQALLVDETLAGFIHGQLLVSASLAVWYAVLLSIARLDFALIIALLAGILSVIPFVGVTICFILTLGLALLQFGGDFTRVGIVFLIFVIGQTVESNILSPKLVGDRVNLHPVWIIFALLAFGALFGFVGVLIALPAAAVIGVLVRFALSRYLQSPLYDPSNRSLHDDH
jgi:predicted PurR-regulated permease PerM